MTGAMSNLMVLLSLCLAGAAFADSPRQEMDGLVEGCWCLCSSGASHHSVFIPNANEDSRTHLGCQKKFTMASGEKMACPPYGASSIGSLYAGTCSYGYGPASKSRK
jgi:hypothetical protein